MTPDLCVHFDSLVYWFVTAGFCYALACYAFVALSPAFLTATRLFRERQ